MNPTLSDSKTTLLKLAFKTTLIPTQIVEASALAMDMAEKVATFPSIRFPISFLKGMTALAKHDNIDRGIAISLHKTWAERNLLIHLARHCSIAYRSCCMTIGKF
ncbi:hypothetical protein V6N11_001568 [Hibiscus sabdariffa]|uniref:Uncharacterized protein n=1 Tax=Hibiscus sabdariffa TaxID=183260 RepID=A0ABR2S066_9ROSI